MPTINWSWAIVLCRFSDIPAIPQDVDYYEDLFTRNGTGGLCDYWRTVSCNALDLTGSRVFGWFTMNHTSSEVGQLHFPGDRSTLVQWGRDTAVANGVNLAPFQSLLVVQNFGVDHGAAGNGILIVHQNATLCEFGFIAHEMGHGLGLPHSFSSNPDMEYGDGWDVMSFATTTFQFPIQFRGTQGEATVGLNARNLEALNAVPTGRAWIPAAADFGAQITLDPLNQPPIGNHGALITKIPANATRPPRANGSTYTVEFHRRAGWDRNIPEDAVLIHEVRSNGLSYLQPGIWGRFTAGQEFVTPDPKVFIRVTSVDATAGTASLRVWDIPAGSLRKEDSKPKVFLIQGGTKRWVTSPQVLFALGKSWADVRVVPDGGLNSLPTGPDVQLPVYAQGSPGNGIGGYDLADPADRVFAFDYDSSGKLDHLALYRPGTGTIWILRNNAGAFSSVYAEGSPGNGIGGYDLADPADRALAFDYNSSGRLDHLVLYRPGFGTIWILRNNGGGSFTPVFAEGSPGNGIGGYDLADPADRVFAFDYDGSGKLDHLVLYRPGFGTIWILRKGAGGQFIPVFQVGSPGNGIGGYDLADPADRVFAFDYNSSGKLDHLVLYRPGLGTLWILKNNAGAFSPAYAEGSPGNGIGGYDLADPADRVFAFDYDGSGKLDHLALYRPGTGTIWILRNNAGSFAPVFAEGSPGTGISGYDLADPADRAFAFDYDGSGKLDHLALYRPGTGTIWIMNRV
jgi:hypothetical protein